MRSVDVKELFEIEKIVDVIQKYNYKKIALQFPDQLLCYAVEVYLILKERTKQELFILGDTTYGSCCVDEISAEHNPPDLLVHFGRACLSSPKVELDSLKNNKYGRTFQVHPSTTLSDYTILYIGTETQTLSNLMVTFNQSKFIVYTPSIDSSRVEMSCSNKILMRRYFLIQKAKDAKIVGILVGTLSSGKYLEILNYLQKIITDSGKKCYTLMLGKINEIKVASYSEIDIYVLVACSENSLLDSMDFYRPVITPFEMQLACVRNKEWSNTFYTDFFDVLASVNVDDRCDYDSDDEPEFSLITGRYRHCERKSKEESSSNVRLRDNNRGIVSASDFFKLERSFKGLDLHCGDSTVKKAIKGVTGTAQGYTSIDSTQDKQYK